MKKETDPKKLFRNSIIFLLASTLFLFCMAFLFAIVIHDILGTILFFSFGAYFFGSFVTMMAAKEYLIKEDV